VQGPQLRLIPDTATMYFQLQPPPGFARQVYDLAKKILAETLRQRSIDLGLSSLKNQGLIFAAVFRTLASNGLDKTVVQPTFLACSAKKWQRAFAARSRKAEPTTYKIGRYAPKNGNCVGGQRYFRVWAQWDKRRRSASVIYGHYHGERTLLEPAAREASNAGLIMA